MTRHCTQQRRRPDEGHTWPHAFCSFLRKLQDSSAEWSKALASGASPQGRGFEPHSCHVSLLGLSGLMLQGQPVTNIFLFWRCTQQELVPSLPAPIVNSPRCCLTAQGSRSVVCIHRCVRQAKSLCWVDPASFGRKLYFEDLEALNAIL